MTDILTHKLETFSVLCFLGRFLLLFLPFNFAQFFTFFTNQQDNRVNHEPASRKSSSLNGSLSPN